MTRRGCFITLEGLDGAGKSTHAGWMAGWLRAAGIDLLETREPGGTPVGEQLRELVLHQAMDLRTETLIMFAARNEHWRAVIRPALERGQWVLCDRYTDASFAYQGGGRQLGPEPVRQLEDWVQQGQGPDCTFLFDVPLETARARLRQGRAAEDRFEREGEAFFDRTRRAYHARVEADPGRFQVIDARCGIAEIRVRLESALRDLLRAHDVAAPARPGDSA